MNLTDLQYQILGKMRLTPLRGVEIMQKVAYQGTNRAFAAALMRMCDKGLIEVTGLDPIMYVTTPAGLGAFLDRDKTSVIASPKP